MADAIALPLSLLALAATLSVAVLRPRHVPDALAAGAGAVILIVIGAIGSSRAATAVRDLGPTVGFLAALLLIAEGCRREGLFEALGALMARSSRGDARRFLGLVFAAASCVTIVLGLDATVVLLPPIVLATATQLRASPRASIYACAHLANSASLLLPVSNLTNLLAASRVKLSFAAFAARMSAAQAASLLVTATLLWVFYWRRSRRGADHYEPPPPYRPADWLLLRITALACLFFIAAILGGVQLEVASTIAAAMVVLAFAIRRRSALRWSLIPWRLPVFVTGLFFVVQTISLHLLHPLTSALVSQSDGAMGTFRAAATGAVLANLVNNLPAYVAGEAAVAAGNHVQLLGLLIGVNVGPVITPWASLATLLWFERCLASGVRIPLLRFTLTSACLAVAGITLSTAALLLT
jgi:arsenical pump membrane protein